MGWNTSLNSTLLEKLEIRLFGTNLGILGVDNCGKSVLFNFIINHELRHNIPSTDTRDVKKNIKIKISELNKVIRLKNFFDVGGQRDLYALKQDTFKNSYSLIYVVRSDLILTRISRNQDQNYNDILTRYRNALKIDFYNFRQWKKELKFLQKKSFSKLIIVGNYFGDLNQKNNVPNYLNSGNTSSYQRDFRECFGEIVGAIDSSQTEVRWITGSLISEEFATQLVLGILKCLA